MYFPFWRYCLRLLPISWYLSFYWRFGGISIYSACKSFVKYMYSSRSKNFFPGNGSFLLFAHGQIGFASISSPWKWSFSGTYGQEYSCPFSSILRFLFHMKEEFKDMYKVSCFSPSGSHQDIPHLHVYTTKEGSFQVVALPQIYIYIGIGRGERQSSEKRMPHWAENPTWGWIPGPRNQDLSHPALLQDF